MNQLGGPCLVGPTATTIILTSVSFLLQIQQCLSFHLAFQNLAKGVVNETGTIKLGDQPLSQSQYYIISQVDYINYTVVFNSIIT